MSASSRAARGRAAQGGKHQPEGLGDFSVGRWLRDGEGRAAQEVHEFVSELARVEVLHIMDPDKRGGPHLIYDHVHLSRRQLQDHQQHGQDLAECGSGTRMDSS